MRVLSRKEHGHNVSSKTQPRGGTGEVSVKGSKSGYHLHGFHIQLYFERNGHIFRDLESCRLSSSAAPSTVKPAGKDDLVDMRHVPYLGPSSVQTEGDQRAHRHPFTSGLEPN